MKTFADVVEFIGHDSPIFVPLLPLFVQDVTLGCRNECAFWGVVIVQVNIDMCVEGAEAKEEVMSLCQHVVKNEEVKGTIDGGTRVVADSGIDIRERAINVRRRGWY